MDMSIINLVGSIELNSALAFLAGLAVHIGKKCYTEDVSLKEYINEHKASTALSFGSLVTAYIGIQMFTPEANLAVYALSGYSIDSLVNRSPVSMARVAKDAIKSEVKNKIDEKVINKFSNRLKKIFG